MKTPLEIQITRTSQPRTKSESGDFGFGRIFTDHMFMMDCETAQGGWRNPRIVPYAPLALDPAAAVLHYSQSLFEGLKAYRRVDGRIQLFRPEFHAKRMESGSQRLCMPSVPAATFLQAVSEFVAVEESWVPSQKGASLYLRPTLIASEAFLGVRPSQSYLFYIIASPVGSYYSGGLRPLRIWVEKEATRAAPGGLGSVKAGANYMASLQAATQAKTEGYDQVLWLDALTKSYVEEVGTMNVFFVFDDEIVTPPLGGTILGGSTRDAALTLLKEWGLTVRERPVSMQEVQEAAKAGRLREVFGTGTAAVISPVGELAYRDGRLQIGPEGSIGSLSQRLYDHLTGLHNGTVPDTHGWTQIIETSKTGKSHLAI